MMGCTTGTEGNLSGRFSFISVGFLTMIYRVCKSTERRLNAFCRYAPDTEVEGGSNRQKI
jgi:hypothetical protein